MRIDLMDHRDLVRGAAEVEETPEGVRCRRMTEAAEEFFRGKEQLFRRARYTAGVRISLVTDSSYLAMRLRLAAAEDEEEPCRLDVLVDRSDCHTFGPDEPEAEFEFFLELPEGRDEDHEVEVFLPLNAEILVCDLELADGALFRPLYCTDERMLLLGDALTMGLTAPSPLRSYAAILAAELHTDVLNWALAGTPLQGGLGALALEQEWQSVLVACGIQDYASGRSAAESAAELTTLLKHLFRRPGITVHVATPLLWPGHEQLRNAAGDAPEDFRRELTAAASAFRHTRVIDGTRLLGTDEELFQPGGMYPSDEGMAVVAENLYRQIIRRR